MNVKKDKMALKDAVQGLKNGSPVPEMPLKTSSEDELTRAIIRCERCPRLRQHCETIAREKRRSFQSWNYFAKPIPNFGDPNAKFLIVGLAPAAHGANRTGRMFTGDRSGQWLFRALHRAGFANQESFERSDDGLILKNCLITATAHCAPPDNKPLPQEIENCRRFMIATFDIHQPHVILALGSIAWKAVFDEFKRRGDWPLKKAPPKFSHAAVVTLADGRVVLGSYHPSQQNTFTGRLTEAMFDQVFSLANQFLEAGVANCANSRNRSEDGANDA